ncbi:MAG: type I restriction enzyme HsdR N-terminal domain-containing protein [Balneolaceae bacterium]
MRSAAASHFPPIIFRGGRKRLWSKSDRTVLENRPEERVRLRFIDYLTLEAELPGSRVGREVPIPGSISQGGPGVRRADIVLYSDRFDPMLLVECKAEGVPLSRSVAEQTAQYNRQLEARWLCLTNARQDYWFEVSSRSVVQLDSPPFDPGKSSGLNFADPVYWNERGFIGSRSGSALAASITSVLQQLFRNSSAHYLEIPSPAPGIFPWHYYRLDSLENGEDLAFSFLADATGSTLVSAILNSGSERGMILLPLESDAESAFTGLRVTSEGAQKMDGVDAGRRLADKLNQYGDAGTELPLFIESLRQLFQKKM